MEINRVTFLRNSVWVFANIISDMCCQLDESMENIRLAAEKCNVNEDIQNFALTKSYCTMPLQPIKHLQPEIFGNDQAAAYSVVPADSSHFLSGDSEEEWEDGHDVAKTYMVQYDFSSRTNEEMGLKAGERVRVLCTVDHDWVEAINLTSNETGLVPLNYLKACKS